MNATNAVCAKFRIDPGAIAIHFDCTGRTYRLTEITGNALAGYLVSHDYSPSYWQIEAWVISNECWGMDLLVVAWNYYQTTNN
ncbi:MAG: hypothetical protein N2235_20730 [Fischerella sp.]|nr:hypothetical protein [Fischerella sp.]